jgi:nitrite reductase/ring-hydroxylating ferredoxin subunit/uncharacterized membrane protein
MSKSPLAYAAAERIEEISALDAPAKAIGKAVRGALPGGAAKDALSGTWLGHALHPLLTDVVIGSWTSALVLDLIGGRDSQGAAEKLIAVGLASAPPTFITGWSDWSDTEAGSDAVRRTGIVHAVSNGTGAVAMIASLRARRRGDTGRGKLWGLVGMGALGLGGWLGAHLSYSLGVGVDTTVLDQELADWEPALPEADLAEGEPRQAVVGGRSVLLVRQNGRVHALAGRCAHRGGPLHKGELGDGTITCPWHGSCFRLEDGSVQRGPSAYPQPTFETRVLDGTIQVRTAKPRAFVGTP